MSKTLRLMSNARIELGRLGERDDVIQAYIDALRSLAQIEDQTVEEKLSILRPLLYGNKLQDPDIELEKDIPMTAECQPRRTLANRLYCTTHSTAVPDVWATYSKDVQEGLTAGELPPAGTLCTVAQHEIDLAQLRAETEPIVCIPVQSFCDCCGPGYRPGDEGCNHSVQAEPPVMTESLGGSALVQHAVRELELIGEDEDTIRGLVAVVRAFSDMHHSGGSAEVAIPMLEKLLRYEPLSPLTHKPSEWRYIPAEMWGEVGGAWQNIRDSKVFTTKDPSLKVVPMPKGEDSPFNQNVVFLSDDVMNYQGDNYYRACSHFVADRIDGGVEFCVKRVGHPGSDHESYSGIVLHTIKENI